MIDDGVRILKLTTGIFIILLTLLIKDLKPVKTVTLPRPYPSFLPYFLEHNLNTTFDINKVESIQFSIGPEITKSEFEEKHGIAIVSLDLE